jgi:hypothetical protein
MKVLWLFNHPAPYKIDFFNELGKKVDLTVLFERTTEGDRSKDFYYEKAKNFKEIILSSLTLGDYNNFSNAPIAYLKKNAFDVIVVNGWSTLTEMKTIRYLKHHKIPYIFAINGGIAKINENPLRRRLKEKYLQGAALYLSPDEHSSRYLSFYGVDPKKIAVYPYSTIYEKELVERPLNPEERKECRLKQDLIGKKLYVTVGSFIPRKNDLQLLEVWKNVSKDKTLLLFGDGPEKDIYLDFIKKNKMTNVLIRPFSPHEKILEMFRLADASIFLTKEDIYGHVVNECLSQGTPVIASNKSNSALKLITNEVDGRLVDLSDNQAILEAIEKEIPETMREAALNVAKKNTIEAMVESHLSVFEEYLKK